MHTHDDLIAEATSLEDLERALLEQVPRQLGVSSFFLRTFDGCFEGRAWGTAFHAFHPPASVARMTETMLPLSDRELRTGNTGGFQRLFEARTHTFDLNKQLGKRLIRSKTYNEFWRPYNIEKQMLSTLAEAGAPLGFIAVSRTRGERDFGGADLEHMGRLRRSMLEALRRLKLGRRCAVNELIAALRLLPIRSALFDVAGRLVWISQDASRALSLHEIAVRDAGIVFGNDALRAWQEAAMTFAASERASGHAHGLHLQRAGTATHTLVLVVEDSAGIGSNRALRAAEDWRLTPREREVFEQILEGLSDKEIAQELSCSWRTVNVHVASVLKKSGARDRTQLMARVCGASATLAWSSRRN